MLDASFAVDGVFVGLLVGSNVVGAFVESLVGLQVDGVLVVLLVVLQAVERGGFEGDFDANVQQQAEIGREKVGEAEWVEAEAQPLERKRLPALQ